MNNNNYVLIFMCFIAVRTSLCRNIEIPAEKFEYERTSSEDGYHFRYKTENSEREEDGTLDRNKGESGIVSVKGSYSFSESNGKLYSVKYVADENGYRSKFKIESETSTEESNETTHVPLVPFIGSALLASLQGGNLG